jgi:uncharacterized protein
MPWEVAREGINWYLEAFTHVKERNPRRIPVIGFYGGEPLLSFDLIKQAVMYARELYSGKMLFTLTTNGTLLSGEVVDFLAENEFAITITLNGPQSEHDRLRVFPDGSGSFGIISGNLLKLREKYPDYYKEKCTFTVDYDAGTDLNLVRRFYEHNDIVPMSTNIKASPIATQFTKWHERYSVEQMRKLAHSLRTCRQSYLSEVMTGEKPSLFLDALAAGDYDVILTRPQKTFIVPPLLPYTATCIPGEKIALDPYGNFHCCEKINAQFPIGNIDAGLDMESIVKMVEMYRKQIYPECIDCPITILCPVCYGMVGADGRFERNPPDLCTVLQRKARQDFADLWSALEAGAKESAIVGIGATLGTDICRR